MGNKTFQRPKPQPHIGLHPTCRTLVEARLNNNGKALRNRYNLKTGSSTSVESISRQRKRIAMAYAIFEIHKRVTNPFEQHYGHSQTENLDMHRLYEDCNWVSRGRNPPYLVT
ncbi:Uncharacterized protein Fot_04396 [Forsythia ovata]|uniref:Uncharacterized protein n=1 Tax=Forsythia ovata TaxID=205694 RepID=A0ABD1XCG5_9LAMI